MNGEAMGRAAPWRRRTAPRPPGWHMIAEIDVAAMLAGHGEQRQLCDALEGVADNLPGLPADDDMALLGDGLLAFARREEKEETTFARLGLAGSAEADGILAALDHWRLLDALHAQDLAEILAEARQEGSGRQIERLAYMLRCFFEGCRRTIALSEMAILLLGGPRLTRAAAASVRMSLARA